MEADDTTEASILSKLQSSTDLTSIHRLVIAHLQPFAPRLKPSTTAKKPLKSSKSKPADDTSTIRPLAKQFLPFLHKSLSVIPKRLSESPKIPKNSALELFDVYRLCLECLNLIAPVLDGKPYAVEVQRIRYIHCLEHWELFTEAEAEGFAVLDRFKEFCKGGTKSGSRETKALLVPELHESVDQKLVPIILEIVVTLAKCGSKRKSRVDTDYWRVISLVNESEPWFEKYGVLDAKDHDRFHHFMVTNLHITALFLVADMKCFNDELIREFSLVTFNEYKKSSSQNQMYKLALKACSSLFSQMDVISNDIIIDVLKHFLGFMASECKIGLEETLVGFLELVSYCANKCHGASVKLCGPVAKHLGILADDFHKGFPLASSFLTLYGTGLLASSSSNQLKCESTEDSRNAPLVFAIKHLLGINEWHHQVTDSLILLKVHFNLNGKEKNSHEIRTSHGSFYWEALNFFCQSLADSIYSYRKDIFSGTDNSFSWDDLNDVFHQFANIFLQYPSATERDRETTADNHRVISAVVVAALMLSFKANQKVEESILLVKNVILTDWIPVKRLKYLYVSLNNIAVILKRKKRLKEAIEALILCCKATWNHLVNLCKMHMDKSHVPHEDLSEKSITDFVKEASERTAFLLQLNQEGCCNIFNTIDTIEECLKCWSDAENLIPTIPTPSSFIKEFVKIECVLSKDVERENSTSLYSLLQSSTGFSKRALGRLLEEVLLSYTDKSHLNPRLCIRMRMTVIGFLLKDIYITKESNLMKSRILIEKGKVLRAHGLERVDECIQCLADAISTLKSLYGAKRSCSSQVHHLLIHAYLMHALCTTELMPSSMVLSHRSDFLQDINAALKLCLSPDHSHTDEECEKSEDTLYLWYQIIDFLSIKGYLEHHPSLYDVIIKLFTQKNFTLAKAVSELWKNRRLSHGLCASPISHVFIETYTKHQIQINSAEFWRNCMEELWPIVVGFDQTNDKLKQAATGIISQVPLSSSSIFFSSQLYYDLTGRLISSGHMIEALSYAKEAHRLRSILLQQKFEYSVEKVTETFDEDGDIIEKSYYGIQTFKVNDIFATKSYEGCFLTPWNVLSCYLESLLQVGVIQEVLGDSSDSEMLLQWGRNISHFQCLPLFESSFASMLGKLYRKQKLWCMAEKELCGAKKTLTDNRDIISCKRCAYMLEISIDQQIGDSYLSSSCISGKTPFTKKLLNSKSLYKSALDKLNLSEWRTSDFISKEDTGDSVISRESSSPGCASKILEKNDSISSFKPETKIEPRRSRRVKKEPKLVTKGKDTVGGQSRRITRSTRRTSAETDQIVPNDRQIGPSADSSHNVSDSEAKCSAAEFQSDITCLCNRMKCWHCLHIEAAHSSSLNNFIHMNWELVYRKLSLRLLVSIGKFCGICDNYHEAQKLLLQTISVLFNKNSSCSEYSSRSLIYLIEMTVKHFPGDVLAVERAALIYYICWFILKGYPYQGTRDICCEISCIGMTKIVSLLKLAFVLSQEAPSLNQKISRLLAVIYVLSTSLKSFSLSPSEEGSESRWASFFHQASLGTHLNHQIHSDMVLKAQGSIASDSEGSLLQTSISTITEKLGSLRLESESSDYLEAFVRRIYEGLPATPVICISLVVGVDANLLNELLHCLPTIRAWILISHLSSDNQHIILLPLTETLEGESSEDDASSNSVVFDCKKFAKQWKCPWVSSVIDEIAPVFRNILEGNYYSSSDSFLEYIKENTALWWRQRNRLDECLSKFLQDMEDLWLGAWKYFLLGEWPNHNYLDSVRKNLFGDKEQPLQHVLSKKCFVGVRPDASSKTSVEFESTVQLLYKRMLEKSNEIDGVESANKKPIILVLDFEVQMLPWESLPILRNREVYRMLSVGSICLTIDRCCQKEERSDTTIIPAAFPLIDPLDSYYLLNPDGDLSRTQADFEDWFKNQNIEGKTGTVPTVEELSQALKNHDLFIYFGHGSGTQYIPGHEIQKLNACAATLLLGCSSGSLYFKGCYMPQGAPISYLLAGSPVIIANLWEVTDKDIDRFGKATLNAWLREREAASTECIECDVSLKSCKSANNCKHRPRIGSFMAQAREACNLGYLIGAAPVCYGVPTGIVRRKNV